MPYLNELVMAMVAAALVELLKVPLRYFQRKGHVENKELRQDSSGGNRLDH
jgi:hypothetical protein